MQSYNDLVKEYRRLAKRADQRLVRLEKASEEKYYKGVKEYSYRTAQTDIVKLYGGKEDKPRFNTKPPENYWALQGKVNRIKAFLSKPTSTKRGIRNTYIKRVNSLNKHYTKVMGEPANLTWQEFAAYHESGLYEKIESQYGYRTAMMAIYKMKNMLISVETVQQAKDAAEKLLKSGDTINEAAAYLFETTGVNTLDEDGNIDLEKLLQPV